MPSGSPLVVQRVTDPRRVFALTFLGMPAEQETADHPWLFEALQDEQLVGALCVRPQPGATALVEPPCVLPSAPTQTATELLLAAVQSLLADGARLAQALLDVEDSAAAGALQAAGFTHAADLAYLAASEEVFPAGAPDEGLQFVAFDESQTDRLKQVIEQTYSGSLDCPALDGARSLHDVLQGYRATGAYDPAHWFFARHSGEDIGCLLLTQHPAAGDAADWPCEVVYMGIVPSARGRGWGRLLVRQAQWHAKQLGRRRILLAVDAANQPAVRTYTECGFTAWALRSVWLKFFGAANMNRT